MPLISALGKQTSECEASLGYMTSSRLVTAKEKDGVKEADSL